MGGAVTDIIKGASDQGGIAALVIYVTLILAGLVVFYWLKIGAPNAQAKREQDEKNAEASRQNTKALADATVKMAEITGANYTLTQGLVTDVKELRSEIGQVKQCAGVGIVALDKVAQKCDVLIASELGQMRGLIFHDDTIKITLPERRT